MRYFFILIILSTSLLLVSYKKAYSQSLTLIHYSETQYNMKRNINWANLIQINALVKSESLNRWKGGSFLLSTITSFESNPTRIINDYQVFSNIEEDNLLINIFTLGYSQSFKNTIIFAGLRNLNQDYLLTNYSQLFINSSLAMFPTISFNNPLAANQPLSALCIHFEQTLNENLQIKSSLYNGISYNPYTHQGKLFGLNPQNNGVFFISECSYTKATRLYHKTLLNSCYYSGHQPHHTNKNYSLSACIEQDIYNSSSTQIGLMGHYSHTFTPHTLCKGYFALGIICKGLTMKNKKDQLGIMANHASFINGKELVVEASYNFPLITPLFFQPALVYVHNNKGSYTAFVIRLYYSIQLIKQKSQE